MKNKGRKNNKNKENKEINQNPIDNTQKILHLNEMNDLIYFYN